MSNEVEVGFHIVEIKPLPETAIILTSVITDRDEYNYVRLTADAFILTPGGGVSGFKFSLLPSQFQNHSLKPDVPLVLNLALERAVTVLESSIRSSTFPEREVSKPVAVELDYLHRAHLCDRGYNFEGVGKRTVNYLLRSTLADIARIPKLEFTEI